MTNEINSISFVVSCYNEEKNIKNTINELYDNSYVPELESEDPERWRNGQMLAPAMLLWFSSSFVKHPPEGELYDTSTTHIDSVKLNAGICMGAAALSATVLGYNVGFNCCVKEDTLQRIAKTKNADIGPFVCALGVGKPDPKLIRNVVPKNRKLKSSLKVSTEEHRKEKIVHYI